MKGPYTGLALTLVLAAVILFTSCIGIESAIDIRGDESGTITLEYRMARALESMGKLDGNADRPPVPVGRADFDRTAARLPGLRVASFSSRTEGEDLVNRVKLEFDGLDVLTGFLDSGGRRAALYREQGKTRLALTLGGGLDNPDPALLELVRSSSEGYSLNFSLTLPRDGAFTFIDSTGRSLAEPPAGTLSLRGARAAAYSCPMGDLLSSAEPVILEVRW
jgi:hypothetical protein